MEYKNIFLNTCTFSSCIIGYEDAQVTKKKGEKTDFALHFCCSTDKTRTQHAVLFTLLSLHSGCNLGKSVQYEQEFTAFNLIVCSSHTFLKYTIKYPPSTCFVLPAWKIDSKD